MKQASKSPRASLPSRPLLATPILRAITIVVQRSFRCRSSLPSNMSRALLECLLEDLVLGVFCTKNRIHTTLELGLKYPKPNIFSKMMTFYKFWKLLLVAATLAITWKRKSVSIMQFVFWWWVCTQYSSFWFILLTNQPCTHYSIHRYRVHRHVRPSIKPGIHTQEPNSFRRGILVWQECLLALLEVRSRCQLGSRCFH